jgi:hypothetical protein
MRTVPEGTSLQPFEKPHKSECKKGKVDEIVMLGQTDYLAGRCKWLSGWIKMPVVKLDENTAVGTRHADHMAPSIRKS